MAGNRPGKTREITVELVLIILVIVLLFVRRLLSHRARLLRRGGVSLIGVIAILLLVFPALWLSLAVRGHSVKVSARLILFALGGLASLAARPWVGRHRLLCAFPRSRKVALDDRIL